LCGNIVASFSFEVDSTDPEFVTPLIGKWLFGLLDSGLADHDVEFQQVAKVPQDMLNPSFDKQYLVFSFLVSQFKMALSLQGNSLDWWLYMRDDGSHVCIESRVCQYEVVLN